MRNNGKIYITLLPSCLKKEICVYLWPIIVLFRLLSYSCLSIRVWTVVSVRGSSVLWAHYTSSMTPWWRHLMEAFPHYCLFVMGIHWSQGPMMRRFGVVLDSRLNKRLSKQLHRRWFETIIVLIMTLLLCRYTRFILKNNRVLLSMKENVSTIYAIAVSRNGKIDACISL